jgi:hypothetical protein
MITQYPTNQLQSGTGKEKIKDKTRQFVLFE